MFNFFLFLIFISEIFISKACVNINSSEISLILNNTYNENCYINTINNNEACCNHFILNKECKLSYNKCIKYEKYIINNIYDHCHNYNNTIMDIPYSDKCYNFTLHLEPYCCDDMDQVDCLKWYTGCNLNNTIDNINCEIPTRYLNNYCRNYTKSIDNLCCNNFNENCQKIYNWCLDNNPNETNIFDLFIGPYDGYTIGSSYLLYDKVKNIDTCAEYCINTFQCRSFDYIESINHCHLNYHVIGDHIDSKIVSLIINKLKSVHYEKQLIMPFDNNMCNIYNPSWIGDGICDYNGGYNTPQCNYDGGDCCENTCNYKSCYIYNNNFDKCVDPTLTTISQSSTKTSQSYTKTSQSSTKTSQTSTKTSQTSTKTSNKTIITPEPISNSNNNGIGIGWLIFLILLILIVLVALIYSIKKHLFNNNLYAHNVIQNPVYNDPNELYRDHINDSNELYRDDINDPNELYRDHINDSNELYRDDINDSNELYRDDINDSNELYRDDINGCLYGEINNQKFTY